MLKSPSMFILHDVAHNVVSRSFISVRKPGFGFGGLYISKIVLGLCDMYLNERHSDVLEAKLAVVLAQEIEVEAYLEVSTTSRRRSSAGTVYWST